MTNTALDKILSVSENQIFDPRVRAFIAGIHGALCGFDKPGPAAPAAYKAGYQAVVGADLFGAMDRRERV